MEKADKDQLMRVLEHCGSYRDCEDCEYDWLEDHGILCTHVMAEGAYALLKEQESETIECKMCGHQLQKDWVWCPWCRWETARQEGRCYGDE